jgi:predicted O-methyltransferase YrrM
MLPVTDIATRRVIANPSGFMSAREREVLVALVESVKAKVMIEMGVQEGQAAQVILKNVSTIERYVGIDVEPGYLPIHPHQLRETPEEPGKLVKNDPRFTLIRKPRGSLDVTPEELPACDVVLIDGDHGRAAVLNDSALAHAVLRPGGIIIWHDYDQASPVDVRDVLDELHAQGVELAQIADTWIAIHRIRQTS